MDERQTNRTLENPRAFIATHAAAAVLLLSGPFGLAQKPAVVPPKPDLHAGGADPSSIPNDVTTEVVLPGVHLTGARVETGSTCKVESFQVTSDTEIKMKVKGTRKIEDKEDQCTLTLRTAGGSVSTWIVVEFTEAEQAQVDAAQRAEAQRNANALLSRAGKIWHLKFAGGATETYTSTGPNADGMPGFTTSSGGALLISVSSSNAVTIIETGCIRSGQAVGNLVKSGASQGQCSPSGSWTATIEH